MNSIEITAKKVDKAIEEGLKELGISSVAGAKIEILDQGGLFRKAKVRIVRLDENGNPMEDKKPVVEPVKEEKEVLPVEEKPASIEKPVAKKEEKHVVKKQEKVAEKKDEKPAVKEKKPTVDTRPAPIQPATEEKSAPARQVSDEQVKVVKEYLENLLALMKIDAKVEIATANGNVNVNLVTEDVTVIGHRGEVLDALQLLAKRAVEEGEDKFIHVTVDSQNYRARREESLVSLARRMAKKCEKTGKKVVLEPMNNNHRRVIHATLSSSDKVITKSEGREPHRRVVILPKRNDKKQ